MTEEMASGSYAAHVTDEMAFTASMPHADEEMTAAAFMPHADGEMTAVPFMPHADGEMTAVPFMPHVMREMTSAEYWISKVRDPDRVLADEGQIKALNKEIVGVPGCHLRDMLQVAEHPLSGEQEADPSAFQKYLFAEVRSYLSQFFGGDNFVASGDPFTENEAAEILRNVFVDETSRESANAGVGTSAGDSANAGSGTPAGESANAGVGTPAGDSANAGDGTPAGDCANAGVGTSAGDSANAGVGTPAGRATLYGICTKMTDIRMGPTDLIVTDSLGDLDFDQLQLDSLKINDPVVIRAESADGRYIYCDAAAMSGWVRKEDIAVCRDREEWLDAWNIPDADVVVVTQGKILLDESHVNPESSGRVLTMGCMLRRVRPEAYDTSVTNRASFYNYAVYLPVRKGDGSYARTIALIPMHSGVSAGFLPLTVRNILTLAFLRIGDAYGWGGMLSTPDCSAYVREIYQCFGLVLPRNTIWQVEMPVRKWRMDSWSNEKKQKLLDTLQPGALLLFKGHIMLYLGENGGRHYIVNALSSMMDPQTGSKVRVRSIVINTFEDSYRTSGKRWLEDLNTAMVPYVAGETM